MSGAKLIKDVDPGLVCFTCALAECDEGGPGCLYLEPTETPEPEPQETPEQVSFLTHKHLAPTWEHRDELSRCARIGAAIGAYRRGNDALYAHR